MNFELNFSFDMNFELYMIFRLEFDIWTFFYDFGPLKIDLARLTITSTNRDLNPRAFPIRPLIIKNQPDLKFNHTIPFQA